MITLDDIDFETIKRGNDDIILVSNFISYNTNSSGSDSSDGYILPDEEETDDILDIDEVTAIYTKKGTALAPVFTPAPGTYSYNSEEDLTVTINCNNEGSTAYHYTTDGSTPTTSCSVYNGPITVSKNTTIKAIACCAGLANSAVSTATYTITKTVAKPTFDTIPGNYNDEQTVSLGLM